MLHLFNILVYQPLYNILIFFYNIIPGKDFGITIIIVTILIKLLLVSLSKKQIESQKKLQELQPKIKQLQEKYKDDKEKQTKELMKFYKENKANPFGGCFPMIIQLIFFIALYRVIINLSNGGLEIDGNNLYHFIHNPEKINHFFLGIIDLTKPSYILAVLAAIGQYWQTKMMMNEKKEEKNKIQNKKEKKEPDFSQLMSQQMTYLGPLLTLFIGIKFAAGLALYWLVSTLFSAFQQKYIFNQVKKDK